MHFHDGHHQVDRNCQSGKASEQSENYENAPKKLRRGGEIGQPSRQPETADHLNMVMQTSKHFGVAVTDHDDAENQAQYEKRKGLEFV
jgi:hypothetical protein